MHRLMDDCYDEPSEERRRGGGLNEGLHLVLIEHSEVSFGGESILGLPPKPPSPSGVYFAQVNLIKKKSHRVVDRDPRWQSRRRPRRHYLRTSPTGLLTGVVLGDVFLLARCAYWRGILTDERLSY